MRLNVQFPRDLLAVAVQEVSESLIARACIALIFSRAGISAMDIIAAARAANSDGKDKVFLLFLVSECVLSVRVSKH